MCSQNAHSSDIVSSGDTNDIISRGKDIQDKHSSEAHRALLESRSVDRVWNFALEELGRININFDPAWMSEYNKVYFDPLQLKRFCIVQIVLAGYGCIMAVIEHPWGVTFDTEFRTTSCFLAEVTGNNHNDPRTHILWTSLRIMGFAMNIVPAIATLVLLSSIRLREMVVQRLSSLAALHLMMSIIGLFLDDLAFECRRVPTIRFYSDVGLPIFINFTYSGMTQDSCKDTAYNETLLRWKSVTAVGCSPSLQPGCLVAFFTLFSLGSSLNIGDRACASLTLVGCFVCVIFLYFRAMLLKSGVSCFLMAMLCLVSAQDTIQCYVVTAQKKRDFMQLKVKKLMNVLTEKLIHTVIPPNVLDAMPLLRAFSHKASLQQSVSDVEFRAAWEIRMATMMFCSLDFDVSTVEDFDNMSRFLEELDSIIHASGMFKYQHVSTGSKFYIIINCPRVACPFDRELQEAEYPSSYYFDMVCLGCQLIRCTNEFSSAVCGSGGGKTIKMKVGVNCGSVAGIVLGKCRRFYCLYGDSMNVAARMSANAKESGLCVSPQIAAHLAAAAASRSSLSAAVSLPHQGSFPSVCIGSEFSSASPAAHCASAAGHTATDAPSEELKRASTRAAETAYDAGFRGLDTLNSTRNTPLVTDLHPSLTETRVMALRDGHSSDVASGELANAASEAHASACATPRLSVVSRGLHPIKGKGLMELFDVLLVGAFDALLLDDGERGREGRIQSFGSTTASETKKRESKRLDVSKSDLKALVDEETVVKMMNCAYNLKDPKMEAEFLESQMYATRARMTGAVCLHSLFALWQMYAVMFPDFREYFMSHGSPALKWRMEVVGMLLYAQVFVAFFVSMGLILWLWRKEVWQLVRKIRSLELYASWKRRGVGKRRIQDQGALPEKTHAAPRRRNAVSIDAGATESAPLATMLGGGSTAEQSLDRHTMALAQGVLMFLLLFFHAMSVAAAQVWPQQSLVLVYIPACIMLNFGMSHTINGLSKQQNLSLVLYSNLLLLPTLDKVIKNELAVHEDQIIVLLGLSALSLAMSLSFGFLKRRSFVNEYFLRRQLLNLGSILFDLVPPIYGLQLIKIEMSGYKCGQGQHMRGFHRVAALQLDICGFTTLSATISPVELANTVNKLFSSFDEVVMDTDSFKIDTIGDAYIMVAWLNEESSEITGSGDARVEMHQAEQTKEDARKCGDMLLIAGAMLEIVKKHNRESLSQLDVRIGIGTGSVVAGMLGDLHKRFSVQGEAMRVIADLEPSAQPGKVHCSAEFINIVSTCERCKAVLSRWDIQQVAQLSPGQHLESCMLTQKMPGPEVFGRCQGNQELASAAEVSSNTDTFSPPPP